MTEEVRNGCAEHGGRVVAALGRQFARAFSNAEIVAALLRQSGHFLELADTHNEKDLESAIPFLLELTSRCAPSSVRPERGRGAATVEGPVGHASFDSASLRSGRTDGGAAHGDARRER